MLSKIRILVLAVILFCLFSLLIIQYYKIQVLEYPKWSQLADRQHFFVIKEPFKRGRFFANTSLRSKEVSAEIPFVYDVQKFHLYIDPLSISEIYREGIAKQVAEILQTNSEDQKKIRAQFDKNSRSRKLAQWLSQEQQIALQKWWESYIKGKRIPKNALYFVADYKRCYPCGSLLGQVLHTVQDHKDETTGRAIPTGGLELYFDKYLSGSPGSRKMMRSPRNLFDTGELLKAPEDGADVYLTIDPVIQRIAEEEIERGVTKAEAAAGWVIVMDPWTGEVLALAQYPFFNPANYREYFNDILKIQHTRVRAITDAVEPGSVIKPLNHAIGLIANMKAEKPLYDPDEVVPTTNGFFPGRPKPFIDPVPKKQLNMNMAIAKSSNIYVARVVEKVIGNFGAPWYRQMISLFGLGQPTGIELPSESWGYVPTPGKKNKSGQLEWLKGTPWSLSIGYGFQANYLQIARIYCAIANGGKLVKPTLVRKIVRGNEVLLDNDPAEKQSQFTRVMPPGVARRLLTAMKYVTKNGGSAYRADVVGYTEAGKTGTAKKNFNGQYSETLYRVCFSGIAPASRPRFVVLVAMDEPKYGYVPGVGRYHSAGVCCGIVFSQVTKRALEYAQVPPDDVASLPKTDRRYQAGKKDWVEESQELLKLY